MTGSYTLAFASLAASAVLGLVLVFSLPGELKRDSIEQPSPPLFAGSDPGLTSLIGGATLWEKNGFAHTGGAIDANRHRLRR